MAVLLYFEHRDEDFARLASGTCPQSVCVSVWCRHVAILNRLEWHLDIWSLLLLRTCHVLETATNRTPLWTHLVCRPLLFNSVSFKRFGWFQYEEQCLWRRVVMPKLGAPVTGRRFGCVCVCVWLKCVYSYMKSKVFTTAMSSESSCCFCCCLNSHLTG